MVVTKYMLYRSNKRGMKLLSEHLRLEDAVDYAGKRRGVLVITDANGVVIPWREADE